MAILAIVGNSLTILVITMTESLQSNAHFLITSLALSDLISGIQTALSITVAYHYQVAYTTLSHSWCVAKNYVWTVSVSGNVWSIFFIAVDRFAFIKWPLHYHIYMTSRVLRLMLAIIWVYALGINLGLTLYGYIYISQDANDVTFCEPRDVYGDALMFYNYSLSFAVLSIVIVALYSCVAVIANRSAQQNIVPMSNEDGHERRK